MLPKDGCTYMHHLRVATTVSPIEQVEHVLLEFLTVLVDILASLH